MTMNPQTKRDNPLAANRRVFIRNGCTTLGGAALASLMMRDAAAAPTPAANPSTATPLPHFPPKAKRVIYLFQSGGPAQQDLFDYKPVLNKMNGQELPPAVRGEQRLTGMSVNQSSLPLAGSHFKFSQHGQSGAWLSDLLPYHRDIVDDVCFIKSMNTEAINHDPAITMFQTGSQIAGRPSLGSWLSYGLGSENEDLPAFIVLVSAGQGGQPLYSRLWGNGFLDSKYQGVQFRGGSDPVLYLSNPSGITRPHRRSQLDAINRLNQHQYQNELDPEIESRIAQYEMAFRMQASVPSVTDFSDEPESTFEAYGDDARTPGTFAANCLLARRLAEKDVRFIQLYHQGWDQHSNLPKGIREQAKETDQASAALIKDLKQRGMLDDTLVIWGGEFGRTSYSQGVLTADNYGRDHHPRCFTTWMAGGGVKPGMTYGATDEFGYNVVENGVHVHDFNATILHQLGIDHERLTYKYQGRRFRLTDVHGEVIHPILG
ncbi:DUF1501 domain-containing protein [Aporhodopirellula aestuarii]|uniref:DUF1501 domain-containing protein n=1 Tax=Aporhodopirellula aestuarii TaxID=2950107 RepID=A0ABT0U0Y5_9BACT|nr:DUF1501 domain-containing protein [Aporhodopirellula aestuarii]MCM2370529.1 DUF1501 domain-containing protein [Aporhodopirellula aestuarii]